MGITAEKENNPSRGKSDPTDSKLIGPRQEYRRTGKAPDASDAVASGKNGEGKKTTPYRY